MTEDTSPPTTADDAPIPGRRFGIRQAGQSLSVFPAAVLTLLPYPVQRRLQRGTAMRRVLALAWPSVLEQSLVTLVGLVDGYIVGHLGAAAIAGVGMGGQVVNISAALFAAIGVGATALVARHAGACEPEQAKQTAGQALMAAGAIGALAAFAVWLLATPVIAAFGGEPEVVRLGSSWLRIVAPSLLPLAVLLVGAATLRGAGDMRGPLGAMVAVNLVNVAVAWTLTHGLFGFPAMGVRGSAVGAMLGHSVGAAAIVAMLIRGRGQLRLGGALPRIDTGRLGRILRIGLPAGTEQMMLQLALTSLAFIITTLGTEAYAAHQIGLRISALSFLPGWGFSVAATTLVGQELGAGRPDRARASAHSAFLLGLTVMSVMGLVLFVFDAPILRLFTDDAEVVRQGTVVIRTSALLQPIIAASFVFSGALRGAGDTKSTLAITAASIWLMRLALSYLFAIALGLGLLGVWLAIGADFAVRASLFWLRFRGGKWAALRV